MPFKDPERQKAYMHEYQKTHNRNTYMRQYLAKYRPRKKAEMDRIVEEWTTLKDRKDIPSDPETEHRLLQRITFLESENAHLRTTLEDTQTCLQNLLRQKDHE